MCPRARVEWVPIGVDVDVFGPGPAWALDAPPGSVIVGFAGSMKPWHGVHDLLDAFAMIDDPRARLVLVGGGPEEDAVTARVASDAALAPRTSLLGVLPHDEMPWLLRALDVAVAPYRPMPDFYFSPLKVLKYLAAGVPVVHPGLGDLPELVGPGGIAYTPGDVDALARTLSHLVAHDEVRAALGAAALDESRRFTWDETARRIEALLDAARARAGVT